MVFFCEMVILVVFNSFNVVKNLKKPDPVARQMPPLYTTYSNLNMEDIDHIDYRHGNNVFNKFKLSNL